MKKNSKQKDQKDNTQKSNSFSLKKKENFSYKPNEVLDEQKKQKKIEEPKKENTTNSTFKETITKGADFFTSEIIEISDRMSNQKHLSALRDAFTTLMPLIFIGAFAAMFNNVLISDSSFLAVMIYGNDVPNVWTEISRYMSPLFEGMWMGTFSFISVYIVVLISYFLTKNYGGHIIFGSFVGIASWLTLNPLGSAETLGLSGGYNLGVNGIFLAIAVGITAPILFNYLSSKSKLRINVKVENSEIIQDSFSYLIPLFLTILFFALIQTIWGAIAWSSGLAQEENVSLIGEYVINFQYKNSNEVLVPGIFYVNELTEPLIYDAIHKGYFHNETGDLIELEVNHLAEYLETLGLYEDITILEQNINTIQDSLEVKPITTITKNGWFYVSFLMEKFIVTPIHTAATHPAGIFFIVLLVGLFWFFGIHGSNIMAPIIEPIWGISTVQNAELYNTFGNDVLDKDWAVMINNQEVTMNIWTKSVYDSFVMIGGAGASLAIVVALLFFSKTPQQKKIANLSLPPSIFNVNEPIMFGLPIIFSPIFFLPWILIPAFNSLIAYGAISSGWVNPAVLVMPWTSPVFLSGFMTTLDPYSLLLTLILFVIAFVAYMPFIIIDTKKQVINIVGTNQEVAVEKYIKDHRKHKTKDSKDKNSF